MKKRIIAASLIVCMLIAGAIPVLAKSETQVRIVDVPEVISLSQLKTNTTGKDLQTRYIGGNLYIFVGSGRPVVGPPPNWLLESKVVVVAVDAQKKFKAVSEAPVIDGNFRFEVPNVAGKYEIHLYGTTEKAFDTLLATAAFTVVK